MSKVPISSLVKLRDDLINQQVNCSTRLQMSKSRVDHFNHVLNQIEDRLILVESEISSQLKQSIPDVEIISICVDNKNRDHYYAAKITFSFLDKPLYRLIDEYEYCLTDINDEIDFTSRVKNIVYNFLATCPDLCAFFDLNEKYKKPIAENIKLLMNETARYNNIFFR